MNRNSEVIGTVYSRLVHASVPGWAVFLFYDCVCCVSHRDRRFPICDLSA